MFKHILLPVDGSPTADRAVEKAVGLAKAFASEVTAIYVIDPYPFVSIGADAAYGQAQYLSAAQEESGVALTAVRERFEGSGVKLNTSAVEGHSVWRTILESASSAGADLIVMGSHGRRGLEKLVLGSTAQRVVSHAQLPVLVVRD